MHSMLLQQRWANNSVFEYYSNTWGRILVFVFVFGWFFETEYYSYSYSGDFLKPNIIRIRIRVIFQTEYYSYSYSGDFLKPNSIRIRWEFFPNTIHILLSIDTFDEPKNVEDAKIPASKHSDHSRQNGIGCIDLTFLHCVLSKVISNFLNEQRKTLLCVFKWFLKLPAPKDAWSHWLHLLTFLHCGI